MNVLKIKQAAPKICFTLLCICCFLCIAFSRPQKEPSPQNRDHNSTTHRDLEAERIIALKQYLKRCNESARWPEYDHASRELLNIGFRQKDTGLIANVYANLGASMQIRGRYDSAMLYCFNALKLSEAAGNDSVICISSITLGSLYNVRKNYQKSLEMYDKALTHAEKLKDKESLYLLSLGNKALAYSWLNKPGPAIELEQKALPLAIKRREYSRSSTLQMNMASNYAALHQYENARTYLENLVNQLPEYRLDSADYCEKMVVIGLIYWDMRFADKANNLLLGQLPLAARLKDYNLLQRTYDTLSVIAEVQQKYAQSLRYYRLAQQYRDSMAARENERMISDLEVNYQTAQKEKALAEKQLQLVQKDSMIQKGRYFIYVMLSGIIVLVLGILLLFHNYRNRKKAHLRNLQYLEQQKEYQMLQALMEGEEKERTRIARDLHDGTAGMLAAAKMHVHSLVLKKPEITQLDGFTQAVKILDEVAASIRKTSHHLMPEVLMELGLDEALQRYCLQLNNREVLLIQYDSFGTIKRYNDRFELSVYRIVQELLNNIVRHSGATEVLVQLSVQEQVMTIAVEDNGRGMHAHQDDEGTGLRHLQSRVRAMNGSMQLVSEPGCGVQVYLEFDVVNGEERQS